MPSEQPCQHCGGSEVVVLFRAADRFLQRGGEVRRVVECRQCGHLHIRPKRPVPSEQSVARESPWWEGQGSLHGYFAYLVRRIAMRGQIRFAASSCSDSGPVLDLSRTTDITEGLRRHGVRAIAASPTPTGLTGDESKRDGVGVCLHFGAPCFLDDTLGGVVALHALEHESDPKAWLVAVRPLLKDDAALVLQVPNAESWQALAVPECWNGFDPCRHASAWCLRDLESLLRESGYRINRIRHFALRDQATGLVASLFPGLDPSLRRARGTEEERLGRVLRNVLYGLLIVLATPLVSLEAASGAGATLLLEAQRDGAPKPIDEGNRQT